MPCPKISENDVCKHVESLSGKISPETAEWLRQRLVSGTKAFVFYKEGNELKLCYLRDQE